MGRREARDIVEKIIEDLNELPWQVDPIVRLKVMGHAMIEIAKALEDVPSSDRIRILRAAAVFNGIEVK